MMSGLVLQLMQSVVQLPEVPNESADDDVDEEELRRRRKRKVDNDVFVEQSYTQALQVAHNFLARSVVSTLLYFTPFYTPSSSMIMMIIFFYPHTSFTIDSFKNVG